MAFVMMLNLGHVHSNYVGKMEKMYYE